MDEISSLIKEIQDATIRAGDHANRLNILLSDGHELIVLRDLLTLSPPVLKELFDNIHNEEDEQYLPFDSFATIDILRFIYMLYPTLSIEAYHLQSSWVNGIMTIAHKYDVISIIKKCVIWADLKIKVYKEEPSIYEDTVTNNIRIIKQRPTEKTENIKLLFNMDHLLCEFEDVVDWNDSSITNFTMCIYFDDDFLSLRKKTQVRIFEQMNKDRELVLDAFNHPIDSHENLIILDQGQLCLRTKANQLVWGEAAIFWWKNDKLSSSIFEEENVYFENDNNSEFG